MTRAKNKRRGLRKLSCPCGAGIYATWSQVERFGLPGCNCGSTFLPDDVELAYALGLDDALVAEYVERVRAFIGGQQGHKNKNHHLNDPHAEIAQEFEQTRAERARAARLAALGLREVGKRTRKSAPAVVRISADPLPF